MAIGSIRQLACVADMYDWMHAFFSIHNCRHIHPFPGLQFGAVEIHITYWYRLLYAKILTTDMEWMKAVSSPPISHSARFGPYRANQEFEYDFRVTPQEHELHNLLTTPRTSMTILTFRQRNEPLTHRVQVIKTPYFIVQSQSQEHLTNQATKR